MQVVDGKCSHCGKATEHRLEARGGLLARNIYACVCGKLTVRCRLCDGMARYSDTWADELCIDHWNEDQTWAPGELSCISKWPSLWAHRPSWVQRVGSAFSPLGTGVESFSIVPLESGEPRRLRVIYVNGLLGQSDDAFSDWRSAGASLFSGHMSYGVRWESRRAGRKRDLAKLAAVEAAAAYKTFGVSLVWAWHATALKAADTGRLLAQILIRAPGQQFVLCGHSLGARVIFYALVELAKQERNDVVHAAHLMGGAVGIADREMWTQAVSACPGGITNYYSQNDEVLRLLYIPAMGFASAPIGRNALRLTGIRNWDVSVQVAGHMEYKAAFAEFARFPKGL